MVILHVIKAYNGDTCNSLIYHSVNLSNPSSCNASFSYSINQTTKTVTFTNTSTGISLYSYWRFGDGSISSTASPTKTYATGGTYTACLKVYNNALCMDSICATFTLTASSCNATFGYFIDSLNKKTVHYYTTNTGSNLTYTWTFGDSTTGTGGSIAHTYANYGFYTACLRVTKAYNGDTCNVQQCSTINVINSSGNCKANFSYTTDAATRKYLTFNNVSTGSNLIYSWNFGDGTPLSTSKNPAHTYVNFGYYTVCLNIVNSLDTSCHSVYCANIHVQDSNVCDATFGWSMLDTTKLNFGFYPNTTNTSNISFLFGL